MVQLIFLLAKTWSVRMRKFKAADRYTGPCDRRSWMDGRKYERCGVPLINTLPPLHSAPLASTPTEPMLPVWAYPSNSTPHIK